MLPVAARYRAVQARVCCQYQDQTRQGAEPVSAAGHTEEALEIWVQQAKWESAYQAAAHLGPDIVSDLCLRYAQPWPAGGLPVDLQPTHCLRDMSTALTETTAMCGQLQLSGESCWQPCTYAVICHAAYPAVCRHTAAELAKGHTAKAAAALAGHASLVELRAVPLLESYSTTPLCETSMRARNSSADTPCCVQARGSRGGQGPHCQGCSCTGWSRAAAGATSCASAEERGSRCHCQIMFS